MDGNISIKQSSTSKNKNLIFPFIPCVDDSTLFKICHKKGEYIIKESVDVAAKWTEQNRTEHEH